MHQIDMAIVIVFQDRARGGSGLSAPAHLGPLASWRYLLISQEAVTSVPQGSKAETSSSRLNVRARAWILTNPSSSIFPVQV